MERGKPHPDLFLKIAEMLGAVPENCVVIEDSALGLEAAYKAGMKAVITSYSIHYTKLYDACVKAYNDWMVEEWCEPSGGT